MVGNETEKAWHHLTQRRWPRREWKSFATAETKVELQASCLLQQVPQFRDRGSSFQFSCIGKRLVIRGVVSSFYLKQLVQEGVRPIGELFPEIEIDNQVNVVSSGSFLRLN